MYVFGQSTDDSSAYQLSVVDCTNKRFIKQSLETVLCIDGTVHFHTVSKLMLSFM